LWIISIDLKMMKNIELVRIYDFLG